MKKALPRLSHKYEGVFGDTDAAKNLEAFINSDCVYQKYGRQAASFYANYCKIINEIMASNLSIKLKTHLVEMKYDLNRRNYTKNMPPIMNSFLVNCLHSKFKKELLLLKQ